jgi:hypothetical protein
MPASIFSRMKHRSLATTSRLNFRWEALFNVKYSKTWDPAASLPSDVDLKHISIRRPSTCSYTGWRVRRQTPRHLPHPLRSNEVLRLISWNINLIGRALGSKERAYAALDLIKGLCHGEGPQIQKILIMLQGVNRDALPAIIGHPWVEENFQISDTKPPAYHFTMMLVSKAATTGPFFRVPFPETKVERDILGVDIPVIEGDNRAEGKVLRVCTTHLEPHYEARDLRVKQLELLSKILKSPGTKPTVIAGIVGGNMNAITLVEHTFHLNSNIALNDAWEDLPPPPPLKPFQRDFTFGRAKGNTCGYNALNYRGRKRLDKFLYTGAMDVVKMASKVNHADDGEIWWNDSLSVDARVNWRELWGSGLDFAGKIGRFGIHSTTDVPLSPRLKMM